MTSFTREAFTVRAADTDPRWICLTPTRNESWIIKTFLDAARTWATDIVVADQLSDDGTRDILSAAGDVAALWNDSPVYDEAHRQTLLLNEARTRVGKRILIALDADEALSANCTTSPEWEAIATAKPGTILRFRWVNVLPGFQQAWIPPGSTIFGFVDDGAEHKGVRIHSPRVPQPAGAPVLELQDIVVLHFQYVVWERMLSKQRWYQALELFKHRDKSPLDVYRQYHHMLGSWESSEIQPLQPSWLDAYTRAGVDFRALRSDPETWWDRELMGMLVEAGAERFRKADIWEHDWPLAARNAGLSGRYDDPRSFFERTAHKLLALTQERREAFSTRVLERVLRLSGW